MLLGKNDLEFQLDPNAERLKVFDPEGKMIFTSQCRNRTTNDGSYGHNGWCPPGSFILGAPEAKNTIPFGAWAIPILDLSAGGPMQQNGRVGIMIHGGGSGLPQPLAPDQGFQITHGCWRVLNRDLALIVKIVHATQKVGKCLATVLLRHPGAALLTVGAEVLAVLDPEE
jgi:hypothetical protein